MKKVLYLTNIEVPYRVRFFNELAKYCDLTVLYERKKSDNRDDAWAKNEKKCFRIKYLNGIKISNEFAFSFGILKEVFSKYDHIIVGCYNSPVQMLAILVMRFFHIPYLLNLDGEPFLAGNSIKSKLKRFLVSNATKYLVAGEKAAESLGKVIGEKEIIPYYFSSLSEHEINEHRELATQSMRSNTILVVGQYFNYKGMDIALEAARLDQSMHYKFVGIGLRKEQFIKDHYIPDNVEIIPFLQKKDLEQEYQHCAMLVLPSRQECWGLVINEAASFGTPIVSTWGSGAAVEFLAQKYPQYLAKPGEPVELLKCIVKLRNAKDLTAYGEYLYRKSVHYSIETSVQAHLHAFASKGKK